MDEQEYSLRFLPLFENDLAKVRDYIAYTLKNPAAALSLIEETEIAIQKRLFNPLSFEPCHSVKGRKNMYYPIYIKNYTILYVVIGNVMEVRRFVYNKRNLSRLL